MRPKRLKLVTMYEFGREYESKNLYSSHTLPNNLLSAHPGVLGPLQALLRKQRSVSRLNLDVVTTKNPISFKNSNADICSSRFGGHQKKLQMLN